MIVIQDFRDGLAGVRVNDPAVALRIDREPELNGEAVLHVQYPAGSGKPAARDVWCQAIDRDWSAGRAIAFQIKPAAALRLSVSFMDGHRVAYTTWLELQGGRWQPLCIPLAELRPNPYFQPPGADTSGPLDVRSVNALGFAPQSPESGSLSIGRLVVIE
jgi:hypothetical protein